MQTILKFLRERFEIKIDNREIIDVSDKDVEKLNFLFSNSPKTQKENKHLRIRPRLQRHQIWSVKKEFVDFLGRTVKAPHPYLVLVNNEPGEVEDEEFVRVFVISPFIEMSSDDDEVCLDAAIIGFPFLVETWNNQPILTEILEEYIGFYEIKSEVAWHLQNMETIAETPSLLSARLDLFQKDFREIEISNAKYLNHSIMSLLTFLENKQSEDSGILVSMFDKIDYPPFFIGNSQKEPSFPLAAKSGIDSEDKYMHYNNDSIPLEIFFRKEGDGFILTIMSTHNSKLFDSNNEEIKGLSNAEKTVYSNLKKGLYTLKPDNILEPIKIRLK